MVGVAQRMLAVIAAVGRPPVVHRHTGEGGQHPVRVAAGLPATLVRRQHSERRVGGDVDPPQPPTDPGAGLVDTHHPGGAERLTGTLDERFQVGRGLGDDGGDAARRHLHPKRLVQDLGAALDRHEMRRGEVRDQRAHLGP